MAINNSISSSTSPSPRSRPAPPRASERSSHARGRLLSVKQVAAACQLSERAVRRAIDDGELIAVKLRSRLRVTPQDLEAWITASRRQPHRTSAAADPRRVRPVTTGTFRALVQPDAESLIQP